MTVEWPKGELGRSTLIPLSFPLSPLPLFPFAFPPSLLHRPASRTDEKGGKRGGKGNRVMDTLDAFPVQGFAYFPWLVKHRHWGPRLTRCALVYSKYTPRRNCAASEWRHARVSSETENLFFLSPPPSFFIYLETGLDRFPPTFSKYTHQYARVFYARDKERFICFNRGTRC